MKKAWIFAPLPKKLALIFFLITFIATCLVGLISYQVSKNMIMQSNIRNATNATAAVAASVNTFMEAADRTAISVYSDKGLHQHLNSSQYQLPKMDEYYSSIDITVRSAKALNDSVAFINIYGSNGLTYTDSAYRGEALMNFSSCVDYFEEYGLNSTQANALWVDNISGMTSTFSQNLILNVRYIRNIYDYNIIGIMVSGIRESALYKQYLSVGKNPFILNQEGFFISHRNKNLFHTPWNQGDTFYKAVQAADQGTFVFEDVETKEKTVAAYVRLNALDWYLINAEPYYQIFENIYHLLNSILLILFFELCISFLVVRAISNRMTASVTELFEVMQRVKQGDMDVRFQASGGDEINRIGGYLNVMLAQIQEDVLYRERSEKIKETAKIKLLQAQINPHLLYNTLDSVYYYLKEGELCSAQEILNAMSSFFKISLSKGEFCVPVNTEIEHIKSYLSIQRMCRDKNISLEIIGDLALGDVLIPKMTLQPIVENSILHGFEGDVSDGCIQVFMEKDDGCLIVTVRDNGVGMLEDEVAELNDYLRISSLESAPKSYGLWNVNQRIQHHFEGESGLTIESEFGEFTTVHIVMDLRGHVKGEII